MSLVLKEESTASIQNPAVGEATLFIDVADDLLKKKLSNGSVETISAAVPLVSSVFGRTGAVTALTTDYPVATTLAPGFQSPTDKSKLDAIPNTPDHSYISDFDTEVDLRIADQKGVALGLATLGADSKIPVNQLPTAAINQTYVVNSQAAMLALSANQGDFAIRTDLYATFVLKVAPASSLPNWEQLPVPTDVVTSVNGQNGVVVLNAADVSAAPLSHVGSGGSQHAQATPSVDGFMSSSDKTKLNTVATGATANQTDAYLLSRTNHTGTQSASTITGLATVATSGAYADISGTPSALPPSGAASGELSGSYPNPSLVNAAVMAKLLTGFAVDWNIITSADSILTALQKLAGRAALSINTVSADVTVPTDYTWIRQSRSVFTGTTKITIQAGGRVTFI